LSKAQMSYESDRNSLIAVIEDMRRDLGMIKYDPRLDNMDLPALQSERDYLKRELEMYQDRKDAERAQKARVDAEKTEIDSLSHLPGERELEKMPPGGKMALRYEGAKMRITRGQLKKIIAEEVSHVISEMEIINADSGEILTVDSLPPKYDGRLTKSDGYDALYDPDFEALRKDLTLDPDVALDMLEEEAAEMYGEVQGDLGTALDMAMGLKMSFPKEWAAALTTRRIKDMYYDEPSDWDAPLEFKTIDDALARWLAERMG